MLDQVKENCRTAHVHCCGGRWLNGRQLLCDSMTEGGVEVEEWDGGCPSSTIQPSKGKQRDGRQSSFGKGTLVSLNRKRESGKDKGAVL